MNALATETDDDESRLPLDRGDGLAAGAAARPVGHGAGPVRSDLS